jgi:hypothetical protein
MLFLTEGGFAMKSVILALPLLFGTTAARADALRADAARVRYHAAETTIAERDIVTAHIEERLTRAKWDEAVRAGHANDAGYWAKRHFDAMHDERVAQEARAREAYARDVAREAFREDRVRERAARRSRG